MKNIFDKLMCFFGRHKRIKIVEYNNYEKKVITKCTICKKFL